MNHAVEKLLSLYESGRIERRHFLGGIAACFAATNAAPAAAGTQAPTKGMLEIAMLHHVELKALDFGRTRDFYQKLFGLSGETRTDRAVLFLPGGGQISIGVAATQPSIDHYAFKLTAFKQQATMKALSDAGYQVRGSQVSPFITDPDGRQFQITGPDFHV